MKQWTLIWIVGSLLGCAPAPVETAQFPIVNGEETGDFASVGTLTRQGPDGNSGTYCSATLVAPTWVLTAAHCLDKPNGKDAFPETLTFYLGPKLTLPVAPPTKGPTGHYLADARILHPEYNPLFFFNDVALLHLSVPVDGVEPIPLREAPLTEDDLGLEVTYVGFGKTGGLAGGHGIKRVATMPIGEIQGTYFIGDFQGSGVCEGDSGGPAFLPAGDGYEMLGVVSGLVGGTPDPCQSDASSSRVDAYRDWILSVISEEAPHCQDHPGMCLCPAGCSESGQCAPGACALNGCPALGACLSDCDSDWVCQERCRRRAQPADADAWQSLVACGSACDGDEACFEELCPDEFAACGATAVALDCPGLMACLASCSGPNCEDDCVAAAVADAQTIWSALATCQEGDCDALENLCWSEEQCLSTDDCPSDKDCHFPVDGLDIGECGCKDDDGDQWCATDECDDSNELVNPGIGELCGDGLDNDCDGDVDEGCVTPETGSNPPDLVAADSVSSADSDDQTGIEPPEVTSGGGGSGGCQREDSGPGEPLAAALLLLAIGVTGVARMRGWRSPS